ncbi:MAG: permease, partial [Firmicutes bacterium]|nr:permease [Bacillota bacterium]
TLFVIPTAGEIPIVQTLMRFGLGPGPAGVLLTTLPAVSLPSLVMVGRAVPARALVTVAVAVAIMGLLTGFAAMALHY